MMNQHLKVTYLPSTGLELNFLCTDSNIQDLAQIVYKINLLMYLVAMKSPLEGTDSLIHQTHPAVHQTHCLNESFRQPEPGVAEVGGDQLGPLTRPCTVMMIIEIFQPFEI